MPTATKKAETHLLPRRCKYCRGNFVPERAQDKAAKFCCPNHRKAYWRFGSLPFEKMRIQIEKHVRKIVREEMAAPVMGADTEPMIRRIVREELAALFQRFSTIPRQGANGNAVHSANG